MRWIREHPQEITLLAAGVYVIAAGFAATRLTHPRLVRAAHGSARRAVLIMAGFHVTLLLCWGAALLVGSIVQARTHDPARTLWVLLPATALLAPWSVLMVPRPARVPVEDYVEVGASPRVARALALTAAPFAVVQVMIPVLAILTALA